MSIILPVRDHFYAIFLQVLTKKKHTRRVYKIHGTQILPLSPES